VEHIELRRWADALVIAPLSGEGRPAAGWGCVGGCACVAVCSCRHLSPYAACASSPAANTLAKVANGLCDNLVTCVVRWVARGLVAQQMG
jgi:hypothetical protein